MKTARLTSEVYGFQYLSGISDATQMFGSCGQLRSIFATSFDYSVIKKSTGMFCGELFGDGEPVLSVRIAADMVTLPAVNTNYWFYAGWALPKSGLSGMATFYSCEVIVGGNGTTCDSGKTGYAMMKVDTVGTAGYLTAG